MRHLMWILTWIAVGIGGALGAASVHRAERVPPVGRTRPVRGRPLG